MRRPLAILVVLLGATACHSRPQDGASTRPTVEDLGAPSNVCFPRRQPDNRGQPNGSDLAAPSTRPAATTAPAATQDSPAAQASAATQPSAAHGTPGHWCQLCAAAAARAAEQKQRGDDAAIVVAPTDGELMQNLPPR